MNSGGYGGMPRRRIRGPLHPPNRPPPSASGAPGGDSDAEGPHQDGQHPSTGQKRGWTSTIRSSSHRSLPWDQPTPTTATTAVFSSSPQDSFAPSSSTHPPRSDFIFQSALSMPFTPQPAARNQDGGSQYGHSRLPRDESSFSIPNSNSQTAFSTASTGSPASFRSATDLEPQVAALGTMSSHGMPSAQQALLEEQRKTQGGSGEAHGEDHYDGPPTKRRRGLAGTIVDTALNAALYTGAAALTAYSLWSAWGRRPDQDEEEPDGGPAVSTTPKTLQEKRLPPGGLDEPPPPYIVHDLAAGPSAPRSPSNFRKQRVFVSSQKNRRRPAFQPHRMSQQPGPSRRALPDAFRQSQEPPAQPPAPAGDGDEEDDEDEMFRRFQDKMNAMIAEGQAALESTPTLGAMDFDDDELNSSALGLSGSTSAPSLSAAAEQVRPSWLPGSGEAQSANRSFSTSHVGSADAQHGGGLVQSQSHPVALNSYGSPSCFPEPIKRSYGNTPNRGSPLVGSFRQADFGGGASRPSHPFGGTAAAHHRPSSPFRFGGGEDSSTPSRLPISTHSPPMAASPLWQSPSAQSTAGSTTPSRRASMLPRPSSSVHARRATGYAPR